jgi:DNA-binding PadR family transcriptional regulator
VLDFAILGLLHEAPMHGYELRKRLHDVLGAWRTFSYGSLYPTLRRLLRSGLIAEEAPDPRKWGGRAKRVYKLTAEGKEHFAGMLVDAGPQTWDDESFGVHMAFFSRTPAEIRMRILEGRRRCVEERREGFRSAISRAGEQIDRYTRELHRLGLETSEREVRWLNELIASEQRERPDTTD